MESLLLKPVRAFQRSALIALSALAAHSSLAQEPPRIEVKPGGLQTSLTLGAYEVNVHDGLAVPASPDADPSPTSMSAIAILQNRSASNILFTFPDQAGATRKFTFRLFDSEGEQLWQSDPDALEEGVESDAVLPGRGRRWRRVVQIPLVLENAPLAAGTYTVEASVDADKQVSATAVFVVARAPEPPPDPKTTGIKGLVVKETGVQPDGTTESPVMGATILVEEIVPPESARPGAPFTWQGVTNQEGRFHVNTPPGRFRVTATLPPSPLAVILPPQQKTVEVTVEQGKFSEVTIRFPAGPVIGTGIKGIVQRADPNGGIPQPLPDTLVQINEIVPPNTLPPEFGWTGRTDDRGRFQATTPAGRFRVTAIQEHPFGSLAPVLEVTKEVEVRAGSFTEVTLEFGSIVPPDKAALVYAVNEVNVQPGNGGVTITARGSVNTGGWSNPRLRPRNSAANGVLEFDFVAQPPPPGVPVTQAFEPVSASITVLRPPDIRGVRVYARTNSKDATAP